MPRAEADAILLSIKPEYVERILNGTKRFEYRRKYPKRNSRYIVIYESSPVMKIVAVARTERILAESPSYLWERTHEYAGIEKEKFTKYFLGKDVGYAFTLDNVTVLDTPVSIESLGINFPPQSFCYLRMEDLSDEIRNIISK